MQNIVFKDEDETREDIRPIVSGERETPSIDRRALDSWLSEVERSAAPPKVERRGLEALRAEMQRAIVTNGDDEANPTLPRWSRLLAPSRLALMLVALVAGGLAAYLALNGSQPAAQGEPTPVVAAAPQVVEAAKTRILAASQNIGVGERLTADTMQWIDWPESALRSEFISADASPEAMSEMAGAVARFEIFAGEPIRAEKLGRRGDGLLSTVLAPGMRGVSVQVEAAAASGGFIVPNDHVDVVLTRTPGGEDSQAARVSDTILHNVRVLAINARLGESGETGKVEDKDGQAGNLFTGEALATLELDPAQAEIIINASRMGRLSLALRPLGDFAETVPDERGAANQSIRISSPFWAN